MKDKQRLIIEVMKAEIDKALGCTDPGAVALAVSRAARELKGEVERVTVTVSRNIYKNGISVGVPGTGRSGLKLAAALGCYIEARGEGLDLLDHVTEEVSKRADALIESGNLSLVCADTPDPLYVKVELFAEEESATAIIISDYTNIAYVSHNGQTLKQSPVNAADESKDVFMEYPLKELYEAVLEMDKSELDFLFRCADINKEAALSGMKDEKLLLNKQYASSAGERSGQPSSVISKAQLMTAAAAEARMSGLSVPVMAISGSGNHGITSFLGVQAAAEELEPGEEVYARALAISALVTIYIKGYVKRMTAFCGCAVAAATGVAAATVYMLGGSFEQGVLAMQSLIGTLGGMFCDGAKESCAYKLSTAAAMAIRFAYMAMDGCGLQAGIGILGNTIEDTFYNLGQLNNPGMLETDKVIVGLIERTQAQKQIKKA